MYRSNRSIPWKNGIQPPTLRVLWIPAFAGMVNWKTNEVLETPHPILNIVSSPAPVKLLVESVQDSNGLQSEYSQEDRVSGRMQRIEPEAG